MVARPLTVMAREAFWKGYLKLSLVTCPVAMTPAVSGSERIRFHTLNRKTGHRVESRYIDSVTGKPVADDDEVKGYQVAEDKMVTFTDEELEAVALESVRTIDIEMFVPLSDIEWIWYDRPYFVTPNDKVGEEAFAVIREAMAVTDMVGIARLVLSNRERAVMLRPRDKGIILWTLRFGDEVRDQAEYFDKIEKAPAKPLAALRKVMEKEAKPWDSKFASDLVEKRIHRLVKSRTKAAAKPASKEAKRQPAGNVISITDALRASLEAEKRKRK